MHETAWLTALVRTVASVARRDGAKRVVGVTVRLGPASALSIEHIREGFADAARGTIAEGARLVITQVGVEAGPIDRNEGLDSIEIET
ncbi:MAG: hydrogenase maturation nickel metallochaperone HypA [Nitrospirota bacterium]